jgi:HEAT repeat protein
MTSDQGEFGRPATRTEPVIRLDDLERGPDGPAEPADRPAIVFALSSTDPGERRRALDELIRWGITESDVGAVSELLLDPDLGVRRRAAEALVEVAELVDRSRLESALEDPADEVRAAAIAIAAACTPPDTSALFPFLTARRWPVAQERAFDVLPRLLHRLPPSEVELTSLLQALSRLPSAPTARERERLGELARAIGRERLLEALRSADGRRLGAVYLLSCEGSPAALRALAELTSDPVEEVRVEARVARERLEERAARPSGAGGDDRLDLTAIERGADAEVVGFLVGALGDPDREVRERAWAALTLVDWDAVLVWVKETLRSGSDAEAARAAHVAERLMLSQVASAVIDRGARTAVDRRGPFESALASFGLEPQSLLTAVLEVETPWRPAAAHLAWRAGGRGVVTALRRLLDDHSGRVRAAVLEILRDAGHPEVRGIALELLASDPSRAVRQAAVSVAASAPAQVRTQALRLAVDDPDPEVRLAAVRELPGGLSDEDVRSLLPALEEADERILGQAVRHLAAPDRSPDLVWEALERSSGPGREALVEALVEGDRGRLERLAWRGLRSPASETRALAVELATRAGTRSAIQGVVEALDDPVAAVRAAAARGLARLPGGLALAALERALSDPDTAVRVEVVEALSASDDRSALGALVAAAVDAEARVRDAAMGALGRMRIAGTTADRLIDRAVELAPAVGARAGWLLQRFVGLEALTDRLGALDSRSRLRGVQAFVAIGGPRATDALVAALSDPDQEVRISALRGLGRLGDRRAVEAVRRTASSDPVAAVAEVARETLDRLTEAPRQD